MLILERSNNTKVFAQKVSVIYICWFKQSSNWTHKIFSFLFCSSVYQDCHGNNLPLLAGTAYHIMVNQSDLYGYIQSVQLKRGHVFEINRLKLVVHPMRCYSGN